MNYTPLNEAFATHHINQTTYGGTLHYSTICIYCKHGTSTPLMTTDGGSFRKCNKCNKHFRATILNDAITNYNYSTHHLHGTN
jgi:hypothetical protein